MKTDSIFDFAFDEIKTQVNFNNDWHTLSRCLRGAVTDIALLPGNKTKFVDNYGRKAIVLGTILGNVVLYEHFNPEAEIKFQQYVINTTLTLNTVLEPVGLNNIINKDGLYLFLVYGIHKYITTLKEILTT